MQTLLPLRRCFVAARAREVGQPFLQPLAHLARRLLGEGDGQDLGRLGAVQQRAQDARHQHPGLARACARLHRHVAARVAGDGVEGVARAGGAVVFVGGGAHWTAPENRTAGRRGRKNSQRTQKKGNLVFVLRPLRNLCVLCVRLLGLTASLITAGSRSPCGTARAPRTSRRRCLRPARAAARRRPRAPGRAGCRRPAARPGR